MPVLQYGRRKFNHFMATVQITGYQHDSYSQGHKQKYRTHIRIYASYYLVDGEQRGKDIISEDHIQPYRLVNSGEILQKTGRPDDERYSDCHKKKCHDYIHDTLHPFTKVPRSNVRHIDTSIVDRHHSCKEIMYSSHEYTADNNPYICSRAECCTGHSSEYRAKSSYVKKLDYEYFPGRERLVINSVSPLISRGSS